MLRRQIEEEPARPRQFNPAIPLVVEQALLWGLAKRPADRPAARALLVDALEGKWQQLQQSAQATAEAERTILAPWSKRYSDSAPTQRSSLPDMPSGGSASVSTCCSNIIPLFPRAALLSTLPADTLNTWLFGPDLFARRRDVHLADTGSVGNADCSRIRRQAGEGFAAFAAHQRYRRGGCRGW